MARVEQGLSLSHVDPVTQSASRFSRPEWNHHVLLRRIAPSAIESVELMVGHDTEGNDRVRNAAVVYNQEHFGTSEHPTTRGGLRTDFLERKQPYDAYGFGFFIRAHEVDDIDEETGLLRVSVYDPPRTPERLLLPRNEAKQRSLASAIAAREAIEEARRQELTYGPSNGVDPGPVAVLSEPLQQASAEEIYKILQSHNAPTESDFRRYVVERIPEGSWLKASSTLRSSDRHQYGVTTPKKLKIYINAYLQCQSVLLPPELGPVKSLRLAHEAMELNNTLRGSRVEDIFVSNDLYEEVFRRVFSEEEYTAMARSVIDAVTPQYVLSFFEVNKKLRGLLSHRKEDVEQEFVEQTTRPDFDRLLQIATLAAKDQYFYIYRHNLKRFWGLA